VEIVGIGCAVEGMLHTDDGVAVTIILPPHLLAVKKKPPGSNDPGGRKVALSEERCLYLDYSSC
jgi:hypothetical protein